MGDAVESGVPSAEPDRLLFAANGVPFELSDGRFLSERPVEVTCDEDFFCVSGAFVLGAATAAADTRNTTPTVINNRRLYCIQ